VNGRKWSVAPRDRSVLGLARPRRGSARRRLPPLAGLLVGLLVVVGLLPGVAAAGATAAPASGSPPTVVLDGARLAHTKQRLAAGDAGLTAALAALTRRARGALTAGPWSVMDKPQTPPSGDKHDFLSQSPYAWPNPATPDGLPYVLKDGQHNPEADRIPDAKDLALAWVYARDLALAWFFTGDDRYAARAELFVRTWFLAPATRMNPNLRYAQLRPGSADLNPGGPIQTTDLGWLLDGVAVLDSGAPGWTAADGRGMHDWLGQFLTWLTTSEQGQAARRQPNNQGSWYDTEVAALDVALDQPDLARQVVETAKTTRIAAQIAAGGRQPQELRRTKSWDYSVYNGRALCRLAEIGRHVGIDLWGYAAPDGGSLTEAIDFLLPAATQGAGAWPGEQLTAFDRGAARDLAHAAAEEGHDSLARAALPAIPVPHGGDLWPLLPAC
jgi:hypothetical protein